MRNLFDIKDRVMVITGGTGVLGTSMTEYLAEQGAKMVVLGRNKEKGDTIVNNIKEKGGEAMFLQTDVNDMDALDKNAAEVLEKYGRVDVLINGAGGNMPGATIGPDKTIFDLDVNAFKTVVDLNLFGTVLPTIAFTKVMTQQKYGNIVNI
ncbi:MAG TPA: SDR family NAD(P)-dependent oxidoreductase, partial [Niabella sp.]|nr:SDR family NAD(P)-dependent oxidoreductase [Niabella sp.]